MQKLFARNIYSFSFFSIFITSPLVDNHHYIIPYSITIIPSFPFGNSFHCIHILSHSFNAQHNVILHDFYLNSQAHK